MEFEAYCCGTEGILYYGMILDGLLLTDNYGAKYLYQYYEANTAPAVPGNPLLESPMTHIISGLRDAPGYSTIADLGGDFIRMDGRFTNMYEVNAPEPGTIALFGFGITAIGLMRRRIQGMNQKEVMQ